MEFQKVPEKTVGWKCRLGIKEHVVDIIGSATKNCNICLVGELGVAILAWPENSVCVIYLVVELRFAILAWPENCVMQCKPV